MLPAATNVHFSEDNYTLILIVGVSIQIRTQEYIHTSPIYIYLCRNIAQE